MTLVQFLLPALMGGLGLAMVAGPLGSFVVWRRMAYFGDTLAHSALLGVAIGSVWRIEQSMFPVILISGCTALTLVFLQKKPFLGNDTLLGILAHTVLSLGIILYTFFPNTSISFQSILIGDLLMLGWDDVISIYCINTLILLLLCYFWRPLINMVIHEDLATTEGVQVGRLNLMMMMVMAVFVAMSMQLTGVLLITALLILPAATARYWSSTPEKMAFLGSIVASISVLIGLFLAALMDSPVGPSIVVTMAVMFGVTLAVKSGR